MIKRLFDVAFSVIFLFLFAPIMVFIAFLVYLNIGKPILFKQTRPGLNSSPFNMVKFTTMTNIFDDKGNLLDDEERLTSFGKFLRSTSLDELPELWNILKGDMSFIGPRPLLVDYLPLYSSEQLRRHEVKPGVTGWAQINGRDSISIPEKVNLDLEYLNRKSFFFDLFIIKSTIFKVIMKDDISH